MTPTLRALVFLFVVCLTGGKGSAEPPTVVATPQNVGPAAVARSRTWRHRRSTVRVIRRTPEVMREDAARISRGDLFSSWSNAAAN